MEEYYHITMNDCSPLPTKDDEKALAEELGITYEELDAALDKHLPFNELLAYIETIRKK